jgi:ATP phosphoribosyltransferase
LKPQNIAALIALGRHDCGFTGADWIEEQQADVVELLDLGFDPVRIVAAIPEALLNSPSNPLINKERTVVVASEYPLLAQRFIEQHQLNAVFVRSFGATEALPPEDADIIVDNTSTGSTLKHNRLEIIATIATSTTRFVASRQAMQNPVKKAMLEEMVMLMKATLEARKRVLLEMNVSTEQFDGLIAQLPAMRSPTVSPLYGQEGYAVKVAVERKQVSQLVPLLVAAGARDILEYNLEKIVV